MLYKDYEPAVLEKLQTVELEILKDFVDLCEKHQIDYFGCGGTLLGAIRHKGFIPWDDDLDFGMTRADYDKFLSVADYAYEGRYRIINPDNDDAFQEMISKWYKVGTRFRDRDAIATGHQAGIGIDICCFDNVADDDKVMRRQMIRAWTYGKFFILSKIARPTLYAYGIKKKILEAILLMGHWFLRLIPIRPKFFYKRALKAMMIYKDTLSKRIAYPFDPTPYTSMLKRDDIYPTQFLEFENIKVRFPKKPEKYLARRYGADYMTLPPVDKRHNHPPLELDFGEE